MKHVQSRWPHDSAGFWRDCSEQHGRAYAALARRRELPIDWSAAQRYLRSAHEAGHYAPGPSDLTVAADHAVSVMTRRRHLRGARPTAAEVRAALRAVVEAEAS